MRCGRVSVRCPDVLSNGANIFAGGVLFVLLERRLDVSAEGRIIFQRHRENYQVAEKEDDGEEDENDEEAMRSRRRSTRRSDFATAANTTTDNNTSSSADLEDPYAIDVRSYRLSSKGSEMVAIALEDDKNEEIDAPVADDR